MSLAKTLLHKAGLLGVVSRLRSGTRKYLKGGYAPKKFWQGWGEVFPDLAFQQGIYATQEWLLGKLKEYPGASKLEVGCGFGRNLDYLGKRMPEDLWGVDISATMLARGRKTLGGTCRLACGDVQDLPFRDRAFDLAFTHGVLMHVPPAGLSGALAEIRRVASGTVLLVEETFWAGMRAPKGAEGSAGFSSVNVNGYTFLHDYAAILPNEGFEILWRGESGGPVNMIYLVCRPKP